MGSRLSQHCVSNVKTTGEMMSLPTTEDLAAQYADAVEFERMAWLELHAHEPGSPARAEAWATWAEAISSTNRAWRELSSRTYPSGQPARPTTQPARYAC
jgi:hypothetical protein